MADSKIDDRPSFWNKWMQWRVVMSFLMCTAHTLSTGVQVVFSMAEICMINNTALKIMADQNHPKTMISIADNYTMINLTYRQETLCHRSGTQLPDGPFAWTKYQTAWIFAAFFIGNLVMFIPGGWICDHLGGKRVLAVSMLLQGVFTVISPMAADCGWILFLMMRFLCGVAQGVLSQARNYFLAKWMPKHELSWAVSLITAGFQFGPMIVMPITASLCTSYTDNGWRLSFYIFGAVTVLWVVPWELFVTNEPESHPFVSEREKSYIQSKRPACHNSKKNKIPWKALLTSGPVWAVVAANVSFRWGSTTMQTFLPMYYSEVLDLSINDNGVLSMIPWLAQLASKFVAPVIYGILITKKMLSETNSMKLSNTFAMFGMAAFVVGAGFLNCTQSGLAVALISLSLFCLSFISTGFLLSVCRIAPSYAASVTGLSFFVGGIINAVGPFIVSGIASEGTRQEWLIVFGVSAGILAFGGIVFLVWGSAEVQPWATVVKPPISQPPNVLPSIVICVMPSVIDKEIKEEPTDFVDDYYEVEDDIASVTLSTQMDEIAKL